MKPTNDWDRVADLYDVYVRTEFDVPFFLQEAKAHPGAAVLELMAGTGRISLPLVEAGVPLTVVDGSAQMLASLGAKLSRSGLRADIRYADVRELNLGRRFDLILLPFQSFSELLQREDRRAVLQRIARHLTEEGRFVCTLHNPPVRLREMNGIVRVLGTYTLDEGRKLVFQGAQTLDEAKSIATMFQFFDEYDDQGQLRSKRFMSVRFAAISRADFEADAAAAGLDVEALFGDYERRPFDEASSPFMIWRLRPRVPQR